MIPGTASLCALLVAVGVAAPAPLDLESALGRSPGGLARITEARALRFPADHLAHDDYATEWWYLTTNLSTAEGRRFGAQLTVFRATLSGPPGANSAQASAWRTRQAYLGHLAITDPQAGTHHRAERWARGGPLGLAGTADAPPRVWLEDWTMSGRGADLFPMTLRAVDGDYALELALRVVHGPILNGDRGYSRKGPQAGNASIYYAYPRLSAHGTLRTPDGDHAVSGLAWLDREWGSSTLGPDQTGWDWFALQLDDGHDLMFYRLRDAAGRQGPYSEGTLTTPAGEAVRLSADAVEVSALRWWQSSETGRSYPVEWRLRIPSRRLDLHLTPLLDDQEMPLAVHYWEGAVEARGLHGDAPVAARGYLEMTGYAPP